MSSACPLGCPGAAAQIQRLQLEVSKPHRAWGVFRNCQDFPLHLPPDASPAKMWSRHERGDLSIWLPCSPAAQGARVLQTGFTGAQERGIYSLAWTDPAVPAGGEAAWALHLLTQCHQPHAPMGHTQHPSHHPRPCGGAEAGCSGTGSRAPPQHGGGALK